MCMRHRTANGGSQFADRLSCPGHRPGAPLPSPEGNVSLCATNQEGRLKLHRRIGWVGLAFACACGTSAPGGGGPSWFGLRMSGPRSTALGIGASADDLRTGWYSNQPALHPTDVGGPGFQQLFDVALDGQIYAQPLVFSGGLLVATENNHVYVLDPVT